MEVDMSKVNSEMQAHAKEAALDEGGWVSNRFQMVEERLARLEEGRGTWKDEEEYALCESFAGETVGKLRAKLGHHDPEVPLVVEVDGLPGQHRAEVWHGQELDEDASTPLRSSFRHKVILRVRRDT